MEYKAEAKRLAEMKASMGKAIDVDLSDEALKHREELKQDGEDAKNRREMEYKSKAKELKDMAASAEKAIDVDLSDETEELRRELAS